MKFLLPIFLTPSLLARLLDLIDQTRLSDYRFENGYSQGKPVFLHNDEFYDVVGITGCNLVVDQI